MGTLRLSLTSSLLAASLWTPAAVGGALLLAPAAAQAQQAAEPIVDLLPVGEVIGDGSTKVTLRFLALNPDGSPLTGLTGKVAASAGNTEALTEERPGVYKSTWTPLSTNAQQVVELSLKGKTAAKVAVSKNWQIGVNPGAAAQITAVANPPQLILGQDTTATVTVQIVGDLGGAASQNDIVLAPSAGTVTNITPLGQGRYSALYTAPPQQFPQMATITIADRRDPSRTYGTLAIPLVGRASFPVTGLPNSRIIVKVGDRDFGPMQADASGRAQVPIMVPPGVSTATVTSVTDAKTQQDPLDLQIPPSQRVRMFPTYAGIPSDPKVSVPIRAYVGLPTGGADAGARVSFNASAGTVSAATHEGNGVYKAMYTPPLGNTVADAKITVTVEDPRGPQTDTLPLHLIPVRPANVTVSAEPPSLPAGAMQLAVFTKVTGPDGAGLTGREVVLQADGAKVTGKAKDLGNGDYQSTLAPAAAGPVQVIATARQAASGNALRRVMVLPSKTTLPNDGLSGTALTVLTLDEFGYPVANVPVTLGLSGEGSVPGTVTTDDSGVAIVGYTAGRAAGVVRVMAKAGNVGSSTVLVVGPTNVPADLLAQGSGTQATQDLRIALDRAVTDLRVDRQGAGSVAVAAAPAVAGPPSSLKLAADPANATPGTVVTLRINVNDANGNGKAGQTLEFIASAGAVGAVQDLGGGSYQASLTVPVGITGELKVSASTADGTVAGFLKIPVAAAPATASWGAPAPTPTPAPAPVSTALPTPPAPPAAPKAPRPPTDMDKYPWLRGSIGYMGGLYAYQQKSEALNGPIYPQDITVGGSVTDPAGAAGMAVHARAWIPNFRYAGVDARFDTAKWAIAFDESSGVQSGEVPDWITEFRLSGLIRYPFMVNPNTLMHVGARAGLSMNDYLVFTKEASSLAWANELTTHFHAGGEVGAEFGEKAFANVGGQLYLADAKELYGAALEVEVGFSLVKNVYASLSGGMTGHNHGIYFTPDGGGDKTLVGNNQDALQWFGVNVGYQR